MAHVFGINRTLTCMEYSLECALGGSPVFPFPGAWCSLFRGRFLKGQARPGRLISVETSNMEQDYPEELGPVDESTLEERLSLRCDSLVKARVAATLRDHLRRAEDLVPWHRNSQSRIAYAPFLPARRWKSLCRLQAGAWALFCRPVESLLLGGRVRRTPNPGGFERQSVVLDGLPSGTPEPGGNPGCPSRLESSPSEEGGRAVLANHVGVGDLRGNWTRATGCRGWQTP